MTNEEEVIEEDFQISYFAARIFLGVLVNHSITDKHGALTELMLGKAEPEAFMADILRDIRAGDFMAAVDFHTAVVVLDWVTADMMAEPFIGYPTAEASLRAIVSALQPLTSDADIAEADRACAYLRA